MKPLSYLRRSEVGFWCVNGRHFFFRVAVFHNSGLLNCKISFLSILYEFMVKTQQKCTNLLQKHPFNCTTLLLQPCVTYKI